MIGQARFFATSLVLLIWDDRSIGVPKVSETNALLEDIGDGLPELTTGGNTSTPHNTRHHLLGVLAKRQPDPAFVGFLTYKRPKFIEFQTNRLRLFGSDEGMPKRG